MPMASILSCTHDEDSSESIVFGVMLGCRLS